MKNVLYLTRRFTGFVVFILSLNQLCGAASNITPDSYPGACSIQISTNTTSLCAGDTAIINVISSDISITCSTVTYSWQSSDNLTQWMNQPVTGETFSYVGASSGKKYFRALVSDCANCMGNGPVYSDTLDSTP